MFDIFVTHHGEKDGEYFSVTESAKFRYDLGWITVIKIIPGMVGVIDVDPIIPVDPPEPIDVTGQWDMYADVGQGEFGPEPFYLEQIGDEVFVSMGQSGFVEGSTLTLRIDFTDDGWPYMLWILEWDDGSLVGDVFASDLEWAQYDDIGDIRLIPTEIAEFGRVDVSGILGVDVGFDQIIDYDMDVDVHTDYGIGYTEYFDSAGTYGIECMKPSSEMTFAIEFFDPGFEVLFGSDPVSLTSPDDFRISMRYLELGEGDEEGFHGGDSAAVRLTVTQLDSDRFIGEISGVSPTETTGEYPFEIAGTFNVGFLVD